MATRPQSTTDKILRRVRGNGQGSVFTPNRFADLGSRRSIDVALLRLVRSGEIRRLARGLYDYPARHPKIGLLAPSSDAIARALADRDSTRLQPTGGYAANLLGLSDQVPVRVVFFTDGRARKVQVGRQQILLKRTTPRQMATAGRITGTVIQALRWLGQEHVDDGTIATLRRQLSVNDKKRLLKDIGLAPAWVGEIFRRVARPEAGR